MGKILSTFTREVKMYNIEARAHKVISKEKPVPAPLHKKSIDEIEQMKRENPSGFNELLKKNEDLDIHLKKVFVVSHDAPKKPETALITDDSKRPLPQLRKPSSVPEFGYVEPEVTSVPAGKFTLKQVLQFLSDHQSQPEVFTASAIAKQYKIDQKLAENMICYYSMFGLHIPKMKNEEEAVKQITESMENLTLRNAHRVVYGEKDQEPNKTEEVVDNKSGKVT